MAEEEKPKRGSAKQSGEKLDRRDPEAALGPPNPEVEERTTKDVPGDLSPADLELPYMAPVGEEIIVKSNAEMPSLQQIDAATSTTAGPAVTQVSVKDVDGNEQATTLTPDNAALISQRVTAAAPDHPAHTQLGWSNPNIGEATDEEREEDQKAYEARAKASA